MTPARFMAKWQPVDLPERAASQEHFIDLCHLLGQPTPADQDATGAEYTFEKGVAVTAAASAGSKGERGFADVWWRGKFGWEYKRKDKYRTLDEAYRQLCQYREALENPPLLIVSDIARIQIHTNFTATRKEIHEIRLEHLGHPDNLAKLRRVFTDPQSFKPTLSTYRLTENAAAEFAKIADQLRLRKHDPAAAAHFLMKCMFCLFAEDVRLLPEGLFKKLLERGVRDPDELTPRLTELFAAMRKGGHFGADDIPFFNGGLFDHAAALPLHAGEIKAMRIAADFDWGAVEPSIFGTLFERSLDPSKRSQIGAHYTSREDIMLIVEPVVMAPLRREWAAIRAQVEDQLARRRKAGTRATKKKADASIEDLIQGFLHRLGTIRILDPACGSGNFLYVAIQELLALEKEVIVFASRKEIGLGLLPRVRPTQLHGIEINPYAAELAQVVIWIGYLQWMRDNGFMPPRDPILAPLQSIECRDAIVDFIPLPRREGRGEGVAVDAPIGRSSLPARPATWPLVDFIIGNPPFLGSKLFRASGLDDRYVQALYAAYDLPKTSDLCCYWFEQARRAVAAGASPAVASAPRGRRSTQKAPTLSENTPATPGSVRTGLLATQGIRGGDNRTVLERIKQTGDIFMAWSDREWILDGANVHVSMVGFDAGAEQSRMLNGQTAARINADLSAGMDAIACAALRENSGLAFQGPVKVGDFDVALPVARRLLAQPNPHRATNADVLRRWIRGEELNKRCEPTFIIDFREMDEREAAGYEGPFEHVLEHVRAFRKRSNDRVRRTFWWRLGRSGADFRARVGGAAQYVATCQTAKHRVFCWVPAASLPAQTVIVFARTDDYFFGVLSSAVHVLWSLRMGTQLETRPRYTPTTCFETFPLPWPPGKEPVDAPTASGVGPGGPAQHARISAAARELNEQRERWLNPPEWIEDWGRVIDSRDKFADVPADVRPLLRWSAIMAEAAHDPRFKKRTLTHLYNERPTWLRLAHEKLDRAVLAAYAAVDPEGAWQEDWADVWAETGAGQVLPVGHALSERRREIGQRVLANLLRMNLALAGSP